MSEKTPFWREYDLAYWQMREALGLSIPDRIDRRFPRKLSGNGGVNPFVCGKCDARRKFPGVNIAQDLLNCHDHMEPEAWADAERRVRRVFEEVGAAQP